jgi:hypothetical protein
VKEKWRLKRLGSDMPGHTRDVAVLAMVTVLALRFAQGDVGKILGADAGDQGLDQLRIGERRRGLLWNGSKSCKPTEGTVTF